MGDEEVEFYQADKHKSFLQDGSITFSVISQTGTKYQKQSLYDIFAISQGKHEWRIWFFTAWQMLKGFSNCYYHFRCVWQGVSKLPEITNFLFCYNMLHDVVDFSHADKHESLLQIVPTFKTRIFVFGC